MPAVAPVERPEEGAGVGGGDDDTGGFVVVVLGDGVVSIVASPVTLVSRTVFVYPWIAAQPSPVDPPSYWYSAQYCKEVGL